MRSRLKWFSIVLVIMVATCFSIDVRQTRAQIMCNVTFITDPSSGTISFMSTTYVNGSSALFSYGTSGLATANAPVGYVFIHWETTGNVGVSSTTDNPTTVTVVGDGTLKAVFAQIMCNVTFVTVPSGTISFLSTTYVNGSSALFAYGTVASATANGPVGYVFYHWETTGNVGVSSTTANPTMVTVTCGGVLKALFTQSLHRQHPLVRRQQR